MDQCFPDFNIRAQEIIVAYPTPAIFLDEAPLMVEVFRVRRNFSGINWAVCFALSLLTSCMTSPPPQPATLRVMTFNIHHGEGTDGKVDLQRIAKLIKDNKADLVSLQEVDRNTQRTGHRDFTAELSALTGMTNVFGKNLDLEGGEYGNAILSWYPITLATNYYLPKVVPGEQRGMLLTHIPTPMGQLVFCAVHLDHRRPEADRLASIDTIQRILRPITQPIIVAGDFNATPESETYKRMTADGHFMDVWNRVGKGPGHTIPSENPRSRIDYLFYRGVAARKVEVLNSNASDHLPLLAEFVIGSR
jgi:endonuclease/exonuclease/phosphatase family metal-dependent hydrolase